MNVQGFQKLTLLDYPGKVACTVFTGGCNLNCPFCHNASLVKTPSEYPDATQEVLAYLRKRQGILDGVCITGGEPLLQKDLGEFIQAVKALGFAVKLDTNGSLPKRLKEILDLGLVDMVAMDIKNVPEGYERAVGKEVETASFLESMELIRRSGVAYEFRTTLVKGIHRKEEIPRLAQWVRPEDPYFLQKFVDSGNLIGTGVSAFSEEEMREFWQILKKTLPLVHLRGQEES